MGYIIWIILVILLAGFVLVKAGAKKKDIPFLAKGLLIHILKVVILLGVFGFLYLLTPKLNGWVQDYKTKRCVKEFIEKNYPDKSKDSLYEAYQKSIKANEFCHDRK